MEAVATGPDPAHRPSPRSLRARVTTFFTWATAHIQPNGCEPSSEDDKRRPGDPKIFHTGSRRRFFCLWGILIFLLFGGGDSIVKT